jgi:uncharacterized protein (TIGR02421 family)
VATAGKRSVISNRLIGQVTDRLNRNLPIRRTLPDGGRLHIDRQLPFLVVYRPPIDHPDAGTARLVRGEASYLIAPKGSKHRQQTGALVSAVAEHMTELFGGFLVIEIWAGSDSDAQPQASGAPARAAFRVVTPRRDADLPSVNRLMAGLRRVKVAGTSADVELAAGARLSPPGMPRLVRSFGTAASPVRLIGIEVRPVYRDLETSEEYPTVTRAVHRQLSRALQQSAYEFAFHQTTHRPRHYQALGRRALVRAARRVDAALADIGSAFDLLLLISPVNSDQAYRLFRRSKYSARPRFAYRHLDVEPTALKRALYSLPIDRVEDPTLEAIFREKQREVSLQLDLLTDRGTSRFLHGSIALYGAVDPEMMATAVDLLSRVPPAETRSRQRSVGAAEFAELASAEIERYRQTYPELGASVELRDDVTSLVVSRGSLLVGSQMRFARHRVEPLIQHEVGTHVVTYWNGMAQPFRLLAAGLTGYDELQEGLAVFAEYLVAGLTEDRLRTLAGRVVAARAVSDGSEFVETFRLLTDEYGFTTRGAFQIAARVHRGGGFVKDAVYLRGLRRVVEYLGDGGRLDTLLVGKIAADHAPVVEELQRRRVLRPAPLRPSYLDHPDAHYRTERLRDDGDLVALAGAR